MAIVYFDNISILEYSGGGVEIPLIEVDGEVAWGVSGDGSAAMPTPEASGAGVPGLSATISAEMPVPAATGAAAKGEGGFISAALLVPEATASAQKGQSGVVSAALPTPAASAAAAKGEGGFISAALPVPAASGTTPVGGTISAALPVPGASATGTAGLSPGQSYLVTQEDESMHSIQGGATSMILTVEMRGTDGLPKTGLAFGSVTASYLREGSAAAATVVGLSGGTAGTWSSGGWVEVDPTNFPGVYQFGVPNAALAAAVRSVAFRFSATACFPKTIQIRILAVNPDDVVRAGMTGLPNAAAGAIGGLPVLSADLDVAATIAAPSALTAAYDPAKTAAQAAALTTLSGDVAAVQADVTTLLETDSPTLLAAVGAVNDAVTLVDAAVAALENVSEAGVTAAVLAGVIDGTKTLQQVLRRLNAYAGGQMTRTGTAPAVFEYLREDDATPEMAHSIDAGRTARTVTE